MARESISKIAYKTLQQSKSIAGFAHKQISSRIMNFILPDSKLESFDMDKDLLLQKLHIKRYNKVKALQVLLTSRSVQD